jgi:uncharacterized protein
MKCMLGGLALFFVASISQAASFDCEKASSNMEKAVCQNPKLSKLDERLASEYIQAKEKLSPAAAKNLTKGQASWLRFQAAACFIDYNAVPETPAVAAECLVQAYEHRLRVLKTTGNMIGSFKTYPMSEYRLQITRADQSIYTLQREYVQVDDASARGRQINAFLGSEEKFPTDIPRGSESVDDEILLQSQDWLRRISSYDSFTGAHPNSGQDCKVYSLSKNRVLLVSDVFTSPAWRQIAIKQAKAYIEQLAKQHNEVDLLEMVLSDGPFGASFSDPFPFCLTANGFSVSGFFPHVAKNYDFVELDWDDFTSVLTVEAKTLLHLF